MPEKPWLSNYDPGINPDPEYSRLPLKDQFLELVRKQPGKPFIYYRKQVFSYAEIDTLAVRLANGMIAAGLKPGERVGVALPNSPELVVIFLACLKTGAIAVLTNPRYTIHELTGLYADCGARMLFCREAERGKFSEIRQRGKTALEQLVVLRKTPSVKRGGNRNWRDYHALIEQGHLAEPRYRARLDDIVVLIYTGGTTGVSKGCCITNRNLIAVASGWKQMSQYFTDVDNYKILSSTPMYHVHGFQTAINANILLGGSMILLAEISVDRILSAINRFQPNVWPAVPAQIFGLLSHPDLTGSKANRIQHIGCGSSPLPLATMERFEKLVGVPIIEGYGASETSMAVASNPICRRKPGSVGIPYPNIDCQVVDVETGTKTLAPGEVGELCFKGPQIIREYWNNPKETALTFRDGWWYSGDVGYLDRDGYIFIVDRKKDMIICSGFKVFCNEVDNVLNSHPQIREAGVIGIPDPIRGETVKAYIALRPGEKVSVAQLKTFCRQYLAAYKVPTHFEFVEQLPRTAIQKLDRKHLRESGRKPGANPGSRGQESFAGPYRPCRGFCLHIAENYAGLGCCNS